MDRGLESDARINSMATFRSRERCARGFAKSDLGRLGKLVVRSALRLEPHSTDCFSITHHPNTKLAVFGQSHRKRIAPIGPSH